MSSMSRGSTPSPPQDDQFRWEDGLTDLWSDDIDPFQAVADALTAPSNQRGQARHNAAPRRTDHSYVDYSTHTVDPRIYPVTQKWKASFPAKLHVMISDPKNLEAIKWQPHGRAWKVINKERLVEEVIPKYFVQTKYESFARQCSGWGFKRLHQPGPDYHCYYHECFLEGLPDLTRMMKRVDPRQGRTLPNAHFEPNFYEMARSSAVRTQVFSYPKPLPPIDLRTLRSSTSDVAHSNTAREHVHEPHRPHQAYPVYNQSSIHPHATTTSSAFIPYRAAFPQPTRSQDDIHMNMRRDSNYKADGSYLQDDVNSAIMTTRQPSDQSNNDDDSPPNRSQYPDQSHGKSEE